MSPNSRHHTNRFYGIVIFILIILIIITSYIFLVPHKKNYAGYVSATRTEQADYLRMKDSRSNKLEYDFIYKGSCPECIKLQPTIAPLLANKKKQHKPLIVLNENSQGLRRYFMQNGLIDHYPTVSVRYKGYLLYQYTGHNRKVFRRIFKGINPKNGKHFRKAIPNKSYIRNDLDHINQVRNGFITSINNK